MVGPEEQFAAVGDDMELLLQPPEQLREAAPAVPLSSRKQYQEAGIDTPEASLSSEPTPGSAGCPTFGSHCLAWEGEGAGGGLGLQPFDSRSRVP